MNILFWKSKYILTIFCKDFSVICCKRNTCFFVVRFITDDYCKNIICLFVHNWYVLVYIRSKRSDLNVETFLIRLFFFNNYFISRHILVKL